MMLLPGMPPYGQTNWSEKQLTDIKRIWDDIVRAINVNASSIVIQDTHANRLALPQYTPAGLPVGQLFYETDRNAFYIVKLIAGVPTWVWLAGIQVGTVFPVDLGVNDAGYTFVDVGANGVTEYVWNGTVFKTVGGRFQTYVDAVNNAVSIVFILQHLLSTGVGANGIGAGVLTQLVDNGGITEDAAQVDVTFTNAVSGSETSDWTLKLRNAGAALAKKFRVLATGAIELIGKIGLYNNAAPTNGQLLIGNTGGAAFDAATLTGTSKQVLVTNGAGAITLATPQNIDIDSDVKFNTVTVSKAQGAAIYVDTSAPTYPFHDILGEITVRAVGANDPTYSVYRNGIRAYLFSAAAMHEVWIVYHMPHDYIPGTDIYFHAHWSNAAAVPNTGNVEWQFEYTSAKGHDQAAFPATATVSAVQASSATRYFHQIAETTAITITGLEPDSLILMRIFRDGGVGSDTCTNGVYLLEADIHYQSSNIGTKNRAPGFYT